MAIDASDNIYFADNDAVWKVTPSGDLTTVAGSGQHAPTVPGPALSSPFDGINDVAVDAHGTVFVAESFQVLKITPDGNLSVVAGTGEYGVPKPGLATKSPLAQPEGLAVDDAGNLYIVNQNGDSSSDEPGAAGVVGATLVKVSPEGELAIVMGGHGNNPATPGPASSSPLGMPWGLGIDAAGNVYVADGGLVAKVAF
jgi:DNA-binding beta-propeller fold protein YncE